MSCYETAEDAAPPPLCMRVVLVNAPFRSRSYTTRLEHKMEEESVDVGEKFSGRVRKKQIIPKDPNAPKKPLSAYNTYAASMRIKLKKKNPERSFGDMNREIGSQWNTMSLEEKQPYVDQSEADRNRYLEEMEEYQKTDNYKKYMKTIAAIKKKEENRKKEREKKDKKKKSPTPQDKSPPPPPPPSRPPPLALKQSFVGGGDIPVFTDRFLQHNREMELQVRKLRQTTMDMEEENALLSRHVDNMKMQIERLESEIANQTLRNKSSKEHLVFLKEALTDAFCDMPVPGTEMVPTVDTIESYLKELESIVAKAPEEHADLVAMVTKVARDVEKRARERETKAGDSGNEAGLMETDQ